MTLNGTAVDRALHPHRLGGLRQGHLHRHGGDDAFGARRGKGGRRHRFHACVRHVRAAVPDAGFLPDFRPFSRRRDRPRLAHLSRPQGRPLRLLLRAVDDDPVRLQGAGLRRRTTAGAMSACCIWNPSSSRSARCGSFICCRCSSSSQNCHAASPPLAVWLVAAALETAHVVTGWTVIDEFCARFVYFYSGYLFASYVFALSDRSREKPALALIGLALWTLVNGGLVMSGFSHWPLISLALGFAGACAIIVMGTLLARMQWLNFLRYCGEHSIVIYLAFFLPMAVTRTLLAEDRPDRRYRDDFPDRDRRGRRRRGSDLAAGAGAARRLPVRAPRRLLDRAEKGERRRCSRRSRSLASSCSPASSAAQ